VRESKYRNLLKIAKKRAISQYTSNSFNLRFLQIMPPIPKAKQFITAISFLIFLFPNFTYGKETNDKTKATTKTTTTAKTEELPKIGNFAVPFSQQLGPLLSFGQNMIGKNQTQISLFADDFVGTEKHSADINPTILYQITDNLSVFFNFPIAASYRQDNQHSSGLEDTLLQFEYAFYSKQNSRFSDQATVVTNVSFPAGSAQKQPATGFGSSTFFLGATFSRTSVEWFGFTSDGIIQTTSHNGLKFGDEFLYQFGVGRNISSVTSKYLFAGLVEINGQYTQRSTIDGVTDPDSGGNVIYITPSLWLSTQKLIVQLGAGFPVVQNLFGEQRGNHYLLVGSLTWTFG